MTWLSLLQPTRGMDIFDTFFLVEYLRQWAARGRVVLLTIQPPTYEIFTMISKVTSTIPFFQSTWLPFFSLARLFIFSAQPSLTTLTNISHLLPMFLSPFPGLLLFKKTVARI
jgi:hypothetical protein